MLAGDRLLEARAAARALDERLGGFVFHPAQRDAVTPALPPDHRVDRLAAGDLDCDTPLAPIPLAALAVARRKLVAQPAREGGRLGQVRTPRKGDRSGAAPSITNAGPGGKGSRRANGSRARGARLQVAMLGGGRAEGLHAASVEGEQAQGSSGSAAGVPGVPAGGALRSATLASHAASTAPRPHESRA